MARNSRIHVPGGVYLAMLRGNGGQAIFPDPADRAHFLDLLGEGTKRFGFRCPSRTAPNATRHWPSGSSG